jgi:hypothetical protein
MEGGIAIFLLLVIILGLVGVFTGAPGALIAAMKARKQRDQGPGARPVERRVEDDAAATQRVPEDLPGRR